MEKHLGHHVAKVLLCYKSVYDILVLITDYDSRERCRDLVTGRLCADTESYDAGSLAFDGDNAFHVCSSDDLTTG